MKHYNGEWFFVSSAFRNLMRKFAYGDEQETTVEEMDLLQGNIILDAAYIREIIRMIDSMSSTEKAYVIAQPEDAVVIISHDGKNKNRKMVRIDKLTEFEEGAFASTGERVYKESIGEVITYEIAPTDQLSAVETLMNRNDRSLGLPLATLDPDIKSQLAQWYVIL